MSGKYIIKHRRGSSEEWKTSDAVIYDGEIVVEKGDDGYTRLKIGDGEKKFRELPYMRLPGYALVTRKVTIELPVADWIGTESPYSQNVAINDITANTQIDLQVSPEQLTSLQDNETSLIAVNDDGKSVVIYAIGEKPKVDYTVQASVFETTDR